MGASGEGSTETRAEGANAGHFEASSQVRVAGFRSLRVWNKARELADLVYDLTESFPRTEFRLVGQMRGAAVSVFANIAEGYSRGNVADYCRFCEIARGSLGELGSYIDFCQGRKMVAELDGVRIGVLHNEVWNLLGGLIIALRRKQKEGSWDRGYGQP